MTRAKDETASSTLTEHAVSTDVCVHWHNGRPLGSESLGCSLRDRGLNYGHGLFETFRIFHNKLLFWSAHKQRLLLGLVRLGLVEAQHAPTYVSQIQRELSGLVLPHPQGVLKLVITAGSGPRGYASPSVIHTERYYTWSPLPSTGSSFDEIFEASAETRSTDLALPYFRPNLVMCSHRLSHQPTLAGIKHLNRLDQVLAATEVRQLGFDDGILLDHTGNVIEATSSNLFLVKNGAIKTPDLLTSGVEGVIRSVILNAALAKEVVQCEGRENEQQAASAEYAHALSCLCEARLRENSSSKSSSSENEALQPFSTPDIVPVTPEDVMAADELFLTNVVFGVRSVASVVYQGKRRQWPLGPLTKQVAKWVNHVTARTLFA